MNATDLLSKLGRIGIWSMEMRYAEPGVAAEGAAAIEALGFGGLWVPGGIEAGVLPVMENLAAGTSSLVIASGIINVWMDSAADVGAWWEGLPGNSRERLLLGLGVSHGPVIGDAYAKAGPLTVMRAYLDELAAQGVPAENLCIAALAPKMLALSRDRTLGTHPYNVPPEHTAIARAAVGPNKLVAPEVAVVLERDPAKARALARAALKGYAALPNYTNNWLRSGLGEEDVAQLSDRLVDRLVAWGEPERIAALVREHHDAGADHVCLQVIRAPMGDGPGDGDMMAGLRKMGQQVDRLLEDCRQLAQILL